MGVILQTLLLTPFFFMGISAVKDICVRQKERLCIGLLL
jgi:hypothetical protein